MLAILSLSLSPFVFLHLLLSVSSSRHTNPRKTVNSANSDNMAEHGRLEEMMIERWRDEVRESSPFRLPQAITIACVEIAI